MVAAAAGGAYGALTALMGEAGGESKRLRFVDAARGREGGDEGVPEGPNVYVLQANSAATKKRKLGAGEGDAGAGEASRYDAGKQAAQTRDDEPPACPLAWPRVVRVGAGLHNCGNTCFLNAVLQCLTHTPAIAALSLSNYAARRPQQDKRFDAMEELRAHVRAALAGRGSAIQPTMMVRTLRLVSRSFRIGRQEDAHEYLRELLEAADRALGGSGVGRPKNPNRPPPLTDIGRVFGGKLRSRVVCTRCKRNSDVYDPCLDVSIDCVAVQSVQKALRRFTAEEVLEKDNAYMCETCKRKVTAIKRLTIHQLPNYLALQLKRFAYGGRQGGKITRFIEYPEKLDMASFTSASVEGERAPSRPYELYGVLVHAGSSMQCGHYYAFVKAANGTWHRCDDSMVTPVGVQTVLRQQAYILFYARADRGAAAAAAARAAPDSFGVGAGGGASSSDAAPMLPRPMSAVGRRPPAAAASAAPAPASRSPGDAPSRPAPSKIPLKHIKHLGYSGVKRWDGTAASPGGGASPHPPRAGFRGPSPGFGPSSSYSAYDAAYDAPRLTKLAKRRARSAGSRDRRLGVRAPAGVSKPSRAWR